MTDLKQKQIELFNKFKDLSFDLSMLGGAVQNDFQLLHADGMTSSDLRTIKQDFNYQYEDLKKDLDEHIISCNNLISYYIDEFEKEENND